MKRNRDDEDDDSDDFVTIGTPLPLYDQDEIPVRKPVTLQDQSVRDAQGRIRFHGAFTGGFSAGYFNTVDTKEGWMPRTFKSSRSQKTEDSQIGQKPEDFMDDEDFSEFGIAPKKVATTKNFTDSENVRKRKAATESHRSDDSLFGSSHLMDLVMPCRSSMGVRLLRKLGWRDSQGIGPRERRKRKRLRQGKLKPSGSTANESIQESQKKYGCAPPPGLHRQSGGGESDGRSSDDDDDNDDGLDGITFAPHDVCPINFDPKANVHGLGYRGIDPTTALFHGNRLNPLPVKTKGRRLGIRGQAFGVGAFEEDDDDIYGVESMTNYDFQIGNDNHKESSTHGWTAPKHATEKRSFEEILKNKDVLDGFRCVSTSILPKTIYPPPQLPRDFRPFHVFESTSTSTKKESVVRSADGGAKMNAFSRGDLLGERPHLRSIFELVSAEDRAKMEAARMQLDLKNTSQQQHQPASSDEPPKEPPASAATRLDEATGSSRDAEADNKLPDNKVPDEPKRFSGFMPFARDPLKQKRYESYLDATRHNRPYVHDNGADRHMTEWEKEREKEEFSKAAHLFQPLSNMIASRFTRAKHDDNDTNVELPAEKEKSSQAKAAEMKMFGKLTRQSCEWHPDKMVCRRFNIADPYPESKIVGLRTAKREKCSIFNFLEFPSQAEEDDNQNAEASGRKETELEQGKESDARPMKPLAILATVDLRPRVGQPRADNVMGAEKTRESSSARAAPSAETNEDATEDGDRRPPIDLFKAIFEDSDSDESSDDESPDKTTAVAETSSVPVISTESVEPFLEDRETEVPPQLTPSIEAKTETAELPISIEASPSLGAVTDDVVMLESADGSEAFGPALPPPTPSVNKPGDQNTSDRRSNSKSSKVKGHHKSSKHKHKHKTHKSTSKKHKQKKKKRKKKTTKATSSQSSGSDADYETDSESPSDIDLRLMSKLKGFVEKGKDKESTVKRKK